MPASAQWTERIINYGEGTSASGGTYGMASIERQAATPTPHSLLPTPSHRSRRLLVRQLTQRRQQLLGRGVRLLVEDAHEGADRAGEGTQEDGDAHVAGVLHLAEHAGRDLVGGV